LGTRQRCREVLGFDGILHAEAFSLDEDSFGVVQEPVEDGRSKRAVVVEDFRPVFERAVGSNHQGALLIALADDLEEQIGTGFVDGQKPQLIQDQTPGGCIF